MKAKLFISFTLLILAGRSTFADTYSIDKDKSVFAVITHKAGYASALAHDHFVFPEEYDTEITLENEQKIVDGRFSITFSVENLIVDDQSAEAKWFPRIKALGIKEDPFPEVSDNNKGKIRDAMIDKGQLDAASYPTILAKATAIKQRNNKENESDGITHTVSVEATIHGKKIVKDFPAKIVLDNDTLSVETFKEYRFTEFGIKPYSAFLGAVKNQDRFHIYVNLTAHRSKDSL